MEEWPGGERLVVTLDQDGQSLMRSFLTSDARFAWKDGCTPNDTNDRAAEPLVLERPLNSTRNPGTAFVDQCRVDPTMNTFPFSFARKQVRVKLLNEETQLNEVDTLTSIRHPHLVAIIGSYQLRGRLNILMFPAASCNLADLLKAISDELSSSPKSDKLEYLGDKKDLSTEVLGGVLGRPLIQKLEILRRSFYCLCTGLSYLHSMDIRHRAIKPSNILFDTSANVLLTDFGVSATEFGASRSFGPQYKAPELLDHPRRRGEAGDVFSLGCVFLEILSVLLGVDTRPWKAQQNDSTKWTYAKNPDLIASWLQHLKNGAGLVPVLDNQKNNHNESVSQTFQIRGNEALAHNAATDENRSSTISSSIEHAGPEYTATRLSPFAHMTTASEYGYLLRETEMSGADTGNSYTNLRPLQDTKVLALVPIVEQMLDWRPECRPSMNTICAEIQNLSLDTCEDCSPRSAYQWISHPAEYTTALNADNFTDSGYSSASTSSKVDVLFITEEIAIFLLDNAMVRSLLERAFRLETRFEVVAGQLRPLIRRYGRNLEEAAQEALHLTIAQEIIRYAPFIANALVSLYTRDTMTHIEDNDDDESATRQQRVEFLLQTRRELYTQTSQKTTSRTMATFEDSVQKLESVPTQDIPSLQISTPAVEDARSFMATAEAMQSFLASLTRMVHTSPLAAVSYEVRRGLGLNLEDLGGNVSSASCNPSIAREVSFTLDFSISDYLHEEFDMSSGSSPNLRALLVLNGEPDCCYASTCEEYVRRYWPETCEDVLHAMGFDTGKTSRSESQASRICSCSEMQDPKTGAITGIGIIVLGNLNEITEIAQQLAWIAAAIRIPKEGEVSLSESLLQSTVENGYTISQIPLQRIEDGPARCWLPLFHGTVLARGYPIPPRRDEDGLELPFQVLISVAATFYPTFHDGGIILQGHSRLLVPVRVFKQSDTAFPGAQASVQWHLKTSGNGRSRFDMISYLNKHTWARISEPDKLAEARTFLGCSGNIVVNLGTNTSSQFHRRIGFSGAEKESHGPSFTAPSSVNVGTSGLGIFCGNITFPVIWGKALTHNISGDHDKYLEILDASAERPVVLYDSSVATAYTVQTSCLLLHMIHTWAVNMSDCKRDIPHIEPSWDAGQAARKMLKEHPDFAIRDNVDPLSNHQKKCKDLVLQFWGNLNDKAWLSLHHQSECQTPQLDMEKQKLYGWEYMDVIWNNVSSRKQIQFGENWISLTGTVLVLFGKNFGDVVKAAPGTQLCSVWNPFPSNRQYLIATIDCLRSLAWKKGGSRDKLDIPQLTDDCWWYPNSAKLFKDCEKCLLNPKNKCEKFLQSLNTSSQDGGVCIQSPTQGAIIFGYRRIRKDPPCANASLNAMRQSSSSVQRSRLVGQIWQKASSLLKQRIILVSTSTDHPQAHVRTDMNGSPPAEERTSSVAGAAR